jgi:hypothetical protein
MANAVRSPDTSLFGAIEISVTASGLVDQLQGHFDAVRV